MPTYNGSTSALLASSDCNVKSGLSLGYLLKFSDIATAPETNGVITALTLGAGKVIYPVEFESKFANANAEFTEGTGLYNAVVSQIRVVGQNPATTLAVTNWVNNCNIVMIVVGGNGVRQVYGLEVVSGVLKISAESGRLTRHVNTFGAKNSADDKPRDEFDYTAQHDYAPLYLSESVDLVALSTP